MTKEDEEFNEAFDNDAVMESNKPEQPDDTGVAIEPGQTTVEPEMEEANEENVWSGASEGAVEQHRVATEEAKKWQQKYKSDQGRFLAAQKALVNPAGVARTYIENKASESIKDPEKWDNFTEEYPEIAEALSAKLEFERGQIRDEVLTEVSAPIHNLQANETNRDLNAQYAELSSAYENWEEIVKSPEYLEWMQLQPSTVQDLMKSPVAADNIYLLDTFSRSNTAPAAVEEPDNKLKNQREQRLESSRVLPTKGGKKTTLPRDDFDAVFAAITQ